MGNRNFFSVVALVAVALSASMAGGCGSDSTTDTNAVTTTAAATTAAATTATAPTAVGQKVPAASVEELVARLYTALNGLDTTGFRALSAPGTAHFVYYVDGGPSGSITGVFSHDTHTLTAGPDWPTNYEPGEPLVSGNVVAVPVAYTYSDGVRNGFDLVILEETDGGLLIAGGVTFIGDVGMEADPAVLEDLVAAGVAAWNSDDVDGVIATMSDRATFWSDVTDRSAQHTGTALREFVADSLWFGVEIVGDPVFSGAYAASVERLTTGVDGISVYWVSDGKIALHAWGQAD